MTLLISIFLLGCTPSETPEETKARYRQNRCRSKVKGSSPSCWNEDDWAAFCERVQCKEVK